MQTFRPVYKITDPEETILWENFFDDRFYCRTIMIGEDIGELIIEDGDEVISRKLVPINKFPMIQEIDLWKGSVCDFIDQHIYQKDIA